jgi:hypothetical protein
MPTRSRALAGLLTVATACGFLAMRAAAPASAQRQDATTQVEQDPHAQHGAVEAMTGADHQHGAGNVHMKLTATRPLTEADQRRADSIVETLRSALAKYKDSNVALKDGYQPFLPNLPLPEYHFTNYRNGFLEAFTFNPARPTSLLYRKQGGEYQLIGAMYTAPKRLTEEQLNARVPLSVATWHAHVNICMPARGATAPDWTRFGLRGAIGTSRDCQEAGGRFFPQLFGWMVHVYPYEQDHARIWMHGVAR